MCRRTPYLTAKEFLDFCGKLYGLKRKEREQRVMEMLKLVGLKDSKTPVSGYSRGMKQRLGIASALMNCPQIIILDEPISALDPIGRHEVMELIESLRGKVTVFFSTHILSDVEQTCDYAVILNHGKLVMADSMDQIKKKYAGNTAVLRLLDEESCNIFLRYMTDYDETNKEFVLKRTNSKEIHIQTNNFEQFQKHLPEILFHLQIGVEKYEVLSPTLEEIFMEVTDHE